MNPNNNDIFDSIQNLKSVLNQQQVNLVKMLAILRQEHQALNNNDLALFEDSVEKKYRQAKKLEEIQPLLNNVEKMLGGVLSKSSFTAFIQQLKDDNEKAEFELLWKNFHGTLTQCDLQNKTNNRILSASATNVKQTLSILRGNTEQATSNVYSETGRQQDKLQGQPLAIA